MLQNSTKRRDRFLSSGIFFMAIQKYRIIIFLKAFQTWKIQNMMIIKTERLSSRKKMI